MKRLALLFILIVIASAFTWALKAQTKPKEVSKDYHVVLTIDQWQAVLNGLEVIKNAVKTSNMSAAQSTFISDSLISIYQNEFLRQIKGQQAAEKLKSEPKKDSTNSTRPRMHGKKY